MKTFEPAYIFP